MMTTSHYTGGNKGWGTLVHQCSFCGEIVAEYDCDGDGIPTVAIFDHTEEHQCSFEDEE